MRVPLKVGAVAACVALIAVGCSSGSSGKSATPTTSGQAAIVWPAPANPLALARAAGLRPEPAEQLQFHVHAEVDVFVNGQQVVVPAGLGIDTTNPRVHVFPDDPPGSGATGYGGIVVPCDKPCISPLHTHDVTGTIHTESSTAKLNTLGQLFIEWDVKLDRSCVNTYCEPKAPIAIYVNGKKFSGDPRQIPLSNYEEIAVVIGTPPAHIPSKVSF